MWTKGVFPGMEDLFFRQQRVFAGGNRSQESIHIVHSEQFAKNLTLGKQCARLPVREGDSLSSAYIFHVESFFKFFEKDGKKTGRRCVIWAKFKCALTGPLPGKRIIPPCKRGIFLFWLFFPPLCGKIFAAKKTKGGAK